MAKKSNKTKKSEENYLTSVLKGVLQFGFSKKELIKVLKKL